jgi:hypothetical protein
MRSYFDTPETIKPLGYFLQAVLSLAKDHFVGPLHRHFYQTIKIREVLAAYWIVIRPDHALPESTNGAANNAMLESARNFKNAVDLLMIMASSGNRTPVRVFIPCAVRLLESYGEYKTNFDSWKVAGIVQAYARMQSVINLLRQQYMLTTEEQAPQGVNLLNEMMRIMNYMQSMREAYPQQLGGFQPNNNNNQADADDNNNLIPY